MSFKKISLYKTLLFLLFSVALFIVVDFVSFFWECRSFSIKAENTSQIEVPVIPQEVLVVLTGDRRRIPIALELLKDRESPVLIISGAGRGATLTELVKTQVHSLENIQAIWKKIILESNSTSTIENAYESRTILRRLGATRVVLITSEYHIARALAIFRMLVPGNEYIAYPVASEFTGLMHFRLGEILEGTWKVMLEYWKFFLFKHYYAWHLEGLK